MSRREYEYEYCEQMLSVYEHQKKQMQKKFKKLNPDSYSDSNVGSVGPIICGNLFYVLANLEHFAEYSALEFAAFETTALGLSYLIVELVRKGIIENNLEKIDLDQLAMNYYNVCEKEKGIHAQMAMIDSIDAKVLTKKRNEENSFYD